MWQTSGNAFLHSMHSNLCHLHWVHIHRRTISIQTHPEAIIHSVQGSIMPAVVPLMFQKIVWATCPHIRSSTRCMFWCQLDEPYGFTAEDWQNAAMLQCIWYWYPQMSLFLYHYCILWKIKLTTIIGWYCLDSYTSYIGCIYVISIHVKLPKRRYCRD